MALARIWWSLTTLVVIASLVGELVNVVRGTTAIDDAATPVRVLRFFSFFTVESNILVAITSALLWREPARDERWFRWLRLAALVGITITGIVYATLLAPVHDPEGSAAVTNVGVHYVSPIATVVGWVLLGPRPRTDWRLVLQVLAWPVVWVLWTFVHGRIGHNHWYPYPFLDVRELGYGPRRRQLRRSGGADARGRLAVPLARPTPRARPLNRVAPTIRLDHDRPETRLQRDGPILVAPNREEAAMLVRLRISLPDRPGSLGRVATALGAAGADIARVDVLGAESGQALDDVFVELSGAEHLERVRFALDRVAGVRVVGAQHPVPPVTGHTELELVDRVVTQPGRGIQTLVDGAPSALGADWCAVLEWGPSGAPETVLAVSAACPGKEAIALAAPLRLQPVRLPRPDAGEPYGGAALVPLSPTAAGLLLVRESGPEYHPAELWRLGQLGEVCGSVLARA